VAEAQALLILKLEAYEASALLAFLQRHNFEFDNPDLPGGDELQAIMDAIEETLPEMSYTPPVEVEDADGDAGPGSAVG
jgi:hypothetical protein